MKHNYISFCLPKKYSLLLKPFSLLLVLLVISIRPMIAQTEKATFPRKFLIEHFTGEACVFCPAGMEAIAEVVEGDEQYIWVSHHAGYMPDEYTIPANGEMVRFLGVKGTPSMVLNRTEQKVPNEGTTLVFHPGYFPNVNVTDEKTAPASVVVKPTYNAEKHELTVEVSGQVGDATDNLLLSVMIVENGLIGEQADRYAPSGGWEEYQHTRVVRKMLSASLGDEVPVADKTYSKTYTTTLQEKWNAEKCMVVAYITKAENGIQPIINAEQAPVVEGTTGGNELMPNGIELRLLTIKTNADNGSVDGGGTYSYGMEIELTAIPDYGFHFVQWSDANTDNPRTIVVTKDATYTAEFAPDTYAITAEAYSGGYVNGGGTYEYGSSVLLTAVPDEHYHFVQWSDGDINNPLGIYVIDNATYVAEFAPDTYTITAEAYSGGYVNGGGIYEYGSSVELTAVPDEHYHFVQWSDGDRENPRTIMVTEDATYTADFNRNVYTVTITCNEQHGIVTGSGEYEYGDYVTIEALPFKGYVFDQWSNRLYKNPYTFKVVENVILEAIFAPVTRIDLPYEDSGTTSKKFIRDGEILILRNGTIYSIIGEVIEK